MKITKQAILSLVSLGEIVREYPVMELLLNPESVRMTSAYPDREQWKKPVSKTIRSMTDNHDGQVVFVFEDGDKLIGNRQKAEYFDGHENLVGNILFEQPDRAATIRNLRKVVMSAQPEPISPPQIQGEFRAFPSEMYCRYGCGNLMGVTFPYYYRPFFGYGYPLLGTESQFPIGYGGNPVTNLGVSGGLGTAQGASQYTSGTSWGSNQVIGSTHIF